MKIWYDDVIYSMQKAGGISVVWAQITRDVPFNANHIRYEGSEGNPFAEKIPDHHYDIKRNWFLRIQHHLNPLLRKEKAPFLFHSSYYRYCSNKNAINITTVHDFIIEHYDKRALSNFHKLQKRCAVMHSDGVICISENTKKDLQYFYPEYNGLIKIINNGYDTESYFYEKKNKERLILSVGSRGYYKRFDITVQIVKALKDCKLVIVGGGQLTEEEKRLLEKVIPGRYEKAGYLSNDELRDLYNRAFFLSYPSDYEGFGIPAIEAQACGCPVICQAKSSLPEVVKDTAIYIDPENMEESIAKIKKMYNDEFYKDIVIRGLENSKRFSWDKCREETIEFYYEVLKHKGIDVAL